MRAAGRGRTEPDADALLGRACQRLSHLVREGAEAGDRDLDLVADLHGTDTLGGAGEDDVAGQQRHHAGDVGDQRRDVEDQVLGRAVLLEVAVEVGLHRDAVGEVCGSRSVSIHGPSGQNESKPLARVNCTSLRCRSRAVTSLPIV